MQTAHVPTNDRNAGQQADQNTEARNPGPPLTLDAALLRIAELEQSLKDHEQAIYREQSRKQRRERTVEKLAKDFCDSLQWGIADAIRGRLDTMECTEGFLTEGEAKFLDEAAEETVVAEQFLEDYAVEDAFPILTELLLSLEDDLKGRAAEIYAEVAAQEALEAAGAAKKEAA
jgi:hypothetical protein